MADTPRPLPKVTVLHYRLICWACLAGIFFACFEQGQLFRGALLILVGMVSLLLSLRAAPGLMMFALGASIVAESWAMRGLPMAFASFDPSDLLLPASMLGFVIGHARVTALSHQLFPDDPRPRPFASADRKSASVEVGSPPSLPAKRGEKTLHADEVIWFVAGIAGAAIAAQLAWMVLAQRWRYSGFSVRFFRLMIVAWILAGSMLLVGALVRLWQRRQLTADQGRLLLQEELWDDLRRDQSRVVRWRAWGKSRQKKS